MVAAANGPLLVSPFVLAELDYLVRRHVSAAAAQALLREVTEGAMRLERFDADDVALAARVLERHDDLDIGLTDASIVVLAHRHGTLDVLTLDERHFRALRGPADQPFRLLPADVP